MRAWAAVVALLPAPSLAADPAGFGKFVYAVEWRLIRAGTVRVQVEPLAESARSRAQVHAESQGLVAALYKVVDHYEADHEGGCEVSSVLNALEGRRHRETRITVDPARQRASYLERDLRNNTTVKAHELEVPACVYDIPGALMKLRATRIETGRTAEVPMTDGKKFARVRVVAHEKQPVKTPAAGTVNAIRHDVFLFDGVIYQRSARLEVWISDDDRRLPLQIRVRTQFPIGTINLVLEKEEK
jgi:hypothetical protein